MVTHVEMLHIMRLRNDILKIRADSKDMIDGGFLRRDFPLPWFLEEVEDAYSWPGERANCYFSKKIL